jgi:hypothetical protein
MAALKIGFNEGSLLRRTLLHVGTFVLGSVAVIGLMSFLITTVVHGLLPRAGSSEASAEADAAESKSGSKPGTLKPATARKKTTPLPVDRPAKEGAINTGAANDE